MRALTYDVHPFRWMACKAAACFSRRAYLGPLSGLRLRHMPPPVLPGPGWVRLRTLLGGICGTDLALVTQRNHPATVLQQFASFPAILGHENVATIDTLGEHCGDWRVGDRVCVEPTIGCQGRGIEPTCPQCAAGRCSLCEHAGRGSLPPRAIVGLNAVTGGSWADFFVAHHSQLHAVPTGVSDEAAVLVDSLASAAHAVLRRQPKPNETVLVHGSGMIALGIMAAMRTLGHDNAITALVRHPFQADLARRIGATDAMLSPRRAKAADRYDAIARRTGGIRIPGRFGNQSLIGGFDLTYDCSGSGAGLTDSMKWTRSRGTLVAVGTSGITLVDTTPLWFDELEIIGVNGRQVECANGRSRHTYELVLDWLSERRIDLSALPLSLYPLGDFRRAFDALMTRGRHSVLKAAFDLRARAE